MLKHVFFLLLFLPAMANAAHITDKLLAGMYAEPNNSEQPTQLLPSGTPVELIGEAKGFVKVQLVGGETGWVEKRFLSEEKPAKVRLLSLQSKYRQLQEKLDRAEATLTKLNQPTEEVVPNEQKNDQRITEELQEALAKAEKTIQQLQQENEQRPLVANVTKTVPPTDNEPVSFSFTGLSLLLLVLSMLIGVYLGIKFQDARQLKRHGGFRI
ncbi:TIGR04211 family SH3 domain-containing protein [Cycloclasticus sp.]|uniref:TIGR04211 family SH3 domain-containing protein n=1 Tax=Cycloclasticus sp. TaxID=2024830 RepID=UPI000C0F1DCD|nr:TIGR04211 family SH3 domain-containing protein [Cycloclasticus sp.]PHR50704.1 MAG: arylsulfatase [Cycloclasticus sp.]